MQRTNKGIAAGWALFGAALTVGAAAVMNTVQAQDAAPGSRPQPQVGAPVQPGSPGIGGEDGAPRPRAALGGTPVMTANERFLFVLRGNTLYKLDVNNLTVLAQTQLPAGGPGGMMRDGDRPAGDRPGGAGRRDGAGGANSGAPNANP